MRIDILTIFPAFFDALDVSLLGKARASGALETHVYDLRDWATDRHRTVDDAPFGGGAGMVMKPDVWGAALDEVLADAGPAVLVLPTPSGELFTQAVATALAGADRLVFACGRYEGIDARVADHYRTRPDVEVRELSLGDYVVNGGEVAALTFVEAIARLVPGVLGNAESLDEESHTDGLLEYPAYTRPPAWRGLDVPDVLASGDHARIARWRRDRALERTATVRPDLLGHLDVADLDTADREALVTAGFVWPAGESQPRPVVLRAADPADVGALAELAARTFPRACPPGLPVADQLEFIATNLTAERFAERIADPAHNLVEVADVAGDLVAYTWTKFPYAPEDPPEADDVAAVVTGRPHAELSKIYVDLEYAGTGIAGALMRRVIAAAADRDMAVLWLGTNAQNRRAQVFYRRQGLRKVGMRSFMVGGFQDRDAIFAIDFG